MVVVPTPLTNSAVPNRIGTIQQCTRRSNKASRDYPQKKQTRITLRHAHPIEFAARCAVSTPEKTSPTAQPSPPFQQHSGDPLTHPS